MSEKFILTLNSHSLANFQLCEMRHALADVICLTQSKEEEKKAFTKGTEIARILQIYYHRKMKERPMKALARIDLLYARFTNKGIPPIEASTMIATLMEYWKTYAKEDIKVIAVEKGFSKILYEDNDNLFVYEGRPDLVAEINEDRVVVDHKTQSMFYNIFPFNNQARGYCWGLDCRKFMYNYLVFKKQDQVRRDPYTFSQNQIDQWVQDTTEWYFRIKHAMLSKKFLRSWNCQGKYGLCEFNELCAATNDGMRAWIMKRDFIIGERRSSW